jgi:hypothetical protein
VQPAFGTFARRIETGQVGTAGQVDQDAAAGIVLRGHHRDRLLGHVDAEAEQLLVDVGKVAAHEAGRHVADVEMHEIEAEALDLESIARATISRGASSSRSAS